MAAARQAWCAAQHGLDPERLIFIDETWTKTNMTRLRGRARKGERLVARVPHGHWRTSTFLAGLRHDRLTVTVAGAPPRGGNDRWVTLPPG